MGESILPVFSEEARSTIAAPSVWYLLWRRHGNHGSGCH